jgi:hypothetical protein
MTKLLNRLGQGWDVIVLVGAYARIAALVGLYLLEKACRASLSLLRVLRALDVDHWHRRR